ncbi:MAG: hypothetical protein CMM26_07035 [Rhodospirillaceae bacterium]|nr:hypothetical protein [Rhodospirillaceae bacterium]
MAFLLYQLSILPNAVNNAIARDYNERFGLRVPEWRMLAALGRFGPNSANGVCDQTAMDKVTVSQAMNQLSKKVLIERKASEIQAKSSAISRTPELP